MSKTNGLTWEAGWQWLAGSRLTRCVLDALFRSLARRHVARLDQQAADRCQVRTLVGLVHQARTTVFGRDHDFSRIRSPADFRRLVPLCRPADLWQTYWQPTFPLLHGVTWADPGCHLANLSSFSLGPIPALPVSRQLWASHRAATWTALSLVQTSRPRYSLLGGQFLFVGERPRLASAVDGTVSGSLEGVLLEKLPAPVRPFLAVPAEPTPKAIPWLQTLAEQSVRQPVTCLAGETGRLLRFLSHLRKATGRDSIRDVWPNLVAVLFSRLAPGPGRAQLASALGLPRGETPLLLETSFRPEAALGVEDPRHGLLRLLTDHGVYFEFVPVEELSRPQPPRHTVREVEPGVTYAVAVSSPAGVWACLVGTTVCFERRQPPLFRVIDTTLPEIAVRGAGLQPAVEERQVANPPHAASPAAPPHPRNGRTPAAPPGTLAHTLWSRHADRG